MTTWSFLAALIFFVSIIIYPVSVKPENSVNSTFSPSQEWKEIEEGQAIPPGLHVRINLSTGKKEGKFIEESEKKTKSLITTEHTEKVEDNFEEDLIFSPAYMKKFLKNVKYKQILPVMNVKKKFRSLKDLKKTFGQLRTHIKTDMEIIAGLIENFKKLSVVKVKDITNNSAESTEDRDILDILVDLEYLVHHYDNAQEFAKLNGFPDVLYKSLNSSNSEIRSEALKVLGSATQSNPRVQIAALETGSINLLLKIFTLDEDMTVRLRSLYALSCLTRRFPLAQQKLIAYGGLSAFAKVFDEEKKNAAKLQLKIIRLLHDLLFERVDLNMNIIEASETENNPDYEIFKERFTQYVKIDLEKKLVEQEWCKRISDWLIKYSYSMESSKRFDSSVVLNPEDFEYHENVGFVVDTLYELADICKTQFESDSRFLNLLFTLKDIYSELAAEVPKEDYGSDLFTHLSNVLKMLGGKLTVTLKKDEL